MQLHLAVSKNDIGLVYDLISQNKYSVNIQDKQGWTALHCAAHNIAAGKENAMEILLLLLTTTDIDTNIPNDSQTTPLHILSKTTKSVFPDVRTFLSALDLMMLTGASPSKTNKQGEIPLHLACASGNIDVVKFLLNSGSDPNSVTLTQQSCLHYATHQGHAEIVRLLLEYGANPDYASPDGTPLDVAKQQKCTEIIQILGGLK